jgi:hypothetical protein
MADSYSGAAVGAARIEEPGLQPRSRWTLAERLAFRFVFVYLMVYMIVGGPLRVILTIETQYGTAPGGKVLLKGIETVWAPVVTWVGHHVHHIALQDSGSASEYDAILSLLILAGLSAAAWSVLDRRAGLDAKRYRGLKDVVRCVLAFVLVLYGMDKVVPNAQFPFPALQTLVTPVGNLSVYSLFWTSMGTSTMYAAFGGTMEVIAAGLLLFSRTTVLGALLAASAMANVAVLNFGFDIPVKVFSFHLLLMSVFVLGGDFVRLTNFLLLNRATTPNAVIEPRGGRFRIARLSLKTIFIVYLAVTSVQACLGIQHVPANRSPLYGIYNVEEFSSNGTVRQPLTTDAGRWKTVIFNGPGYIWIRRMDDSVQTAPAEYDAARGALTISGKLKKDPKSVLTCTRPDQEHLVLQGAFQNQTLDVKLTRVDESKFKLTKSRVPWILGNH